MLLNFFATWCGPCNAELPHLQELWNDLKANERITMLVVSREETEDTVAAFISTHGFTFPVALDPSAAAFSQFAKESIPRTYLIGRDGTILFQTLGFADDSRFYQRELATLRRTIDRELTSNPERRAATPGIRIPGLNDCMAAACALWQCCSSYGYAITSTQLPLGRNTARRRLRWSSRSGRRRLRRRALRWVGVRGGEFAEGIEGTCNRHNFDGTDRPRKGMRKVPLHPPRSRDSGIWLDILRRVP